MAKVEATQSYGAETVLTGAMFDDALAAATARADETGATFVHAFEDPLVIAGQGTIGLELVEQVPDATTFLLPIGGGGLAAGIATVLRALRPGVRIVGVQAGKTSGAHDCRRHPRQAPGRADDVDPRRPARRHRPCRGRRDRGGDHAPARAVEARRRRRGRRVGRSADARRGGRRQRVRAALRREHRRDAARLGRAPRADARRALSRAPHARARPSRRAREAARACRRRTRQHRSRSTTGARDSGSTSQRPGWS